MESRRLWLSVALALVCWINSVRAQTNPSDVVAMQALQQQWGSAIGWTGGDPCVGWSGVTCNGTRVTGLSLINMGLTGSIPIAIGDLSALTSLDLSFNRNLRGQIPSELGSLASLTTLSLQKCSLSGPIPGRLGNLASLAFLALNNNRLSGSIPSALGALTKLTWFDVAYNRLTGPLPVSTTSTDGLGIDSWPNILHYHLNDNGFTGEIPPEIGNAKKVVHVLLENNQLTGPIPASLGNMSSLQILSLQNNQLTGPIPSTLNSIVKSTTDTTVVGLHQIRMNNNKLTGTIPTLTALNQLEFVDFSNNLFSPQPFPSWLNASLNLESIIMDNSSVVGPLPIDLLSYPNLEGVYLRNNQINGSLNIPLNLGSNLRYVYLQNNKIVSITQSDTNANLPEIQLAGNPTCTGGGLTIASATVCNTSNPLPATKWVSPLVGIGNTCQTSCEGKNGKIQNPFSCSCSYPLIVTLEIRAPTFTNIDDDKLWDQLAVQTNNSLAKIPVIAGTFQLWVRDAGYNGTEKVNVRLFFFPLVGDVLAEKAVTALTAAFSTQKVAYQSPFKPEIVSDITSSAQETSGVSNKLSKGAIIGIGVGAAFGVVLIALLAFLAIKQKRKVKAERKKNPFAAWAKAEDGTAPQLKGAHWFSFDDIKRMTNNFSDENELGAGGYGKVYKGIQAGTGTTVAVKRAQEGSKQGAQEFKNEIELLSRVHHNNLVGLVGFCFEKSEQMLVYEYMPNGTLTDWLRGHRADNPLDWDRRLLIALGAARGLAYLHHNADPKIIHRDVKSCNILLDKELNSKVADFGLSMLVPDAKDGDLKKTIKGTMGYLDPEYYMTSVLSTKSDVYSFGVVLLELLTGRPPVSRNGHIVKEVRNKYDAMGMASVKELVDPVLRGTQEDELETFVQIALVCVEDSSLERPSMHDVVKQLEVLVGPKAQVMPGHQSIESRMSNRERRTPLHIPSLVSDDFEPASGQFTQTSSGSHSFKYSGGFAPLPVQPK